jgi:tetratricopeptide (TPR) repeat protein
MTREKQRLKSFRIFLLLVIGLCPPYCNAQTWIRLSAPGLEMYTSDNAPNARAALHAFELARAYFEQSGRFPLPPRRPLRVFAFRSREEYIEFQIHPYALAHYLHGRTRDYIVLPDIQPEHLNIALHEYTHYMLASLNIPHWLREGLAEVYCTMALDGGTVTIGRADPRRLRALEFNNSIQLDDLLDASDNFRDPNAAAVFYSKSWALSHMLLLNKDYSGKFPQFLSLVSTGKSTGEAFSSVYQKSWSQMEGELQRYVTQTFHEVSAEVRVPQQPLDESILKPLDRDLVLTDLLAAHPATIAKAQTKFAELAALYPDDANLESLLGDIAFQEDRLAEARYHLTRALTLGSRDAQTLFQCVRVERQSALPNPEVVRLLESALTSAGGNQESIFELGLLEFKRAQYTSASATLLRLENIKPEWAYSFYLVMAYCSLHGNQLQEAAHYAQRAAEYSKTSDESSEANRLLERVGAANGDLVSSSYNQRIPNIATTPAATTADDTITNLRVSSHRRTSW